jgi:hypothetical protein
VLDGYAESCDSLSCLLRGVLHLVLCVHFGTVLRAVLQDIMVVPESLLHYL